MKYKCNVILTKSQINQLGLSDRLNEFKPEYKSLLDDLEKDITWIHNNEKMIVDCVCSAVYEFYCADLIDEKVISRNLFYGLVKRELNLTIKQVRLDENRIKKCFCKNI